MVSKTNLDDAYLKMARITGNLSYATRKKVGCLIVKGGQIISNGINGMPSGSSNICEDLYGKTKPEVLHAESNAIAKLARGTQSGEGATAYLTLSPCIQCAKLFIQTGIKEVHFTELYKDYEGIKMLLENEVRVVFHEDFSKWKYNILTSYDADEMLCYLIGLLDEMKFLEIKGLEGEIKKYYPRFFQGLPLDKMEWGIVKLLSGRRGLYMRVDGIYKRLDLR